MSVAVWMMTAWRWRVITTIIATVMEMQVIYSHSRSPLIQRSIPPLPLRVFRIVFRRWVAVARLPLLLILQWQPMITRCDGWHEKCEENHSTHNRRLASRPAVSSLPSLVVASRTIVGWRTSMQETAMVAAVEIALIVILPQEKKLRIAHGHHLPPSFAQCILPGHCFRGIHNFHRHRSCCSRARCHPVPVVEKKVDCYDRIS
mmetsp:Transcript_14018/g.25302  ORF Transcript_14018/g.25302 Transcript_14018/m.25302 type:complete len:203 (+) Transcript_14018:1630-2238(+)